jgi:hypothetical protein
LFTRQHWSAAGQGDKPHEPQPGVSRNHDWSVQVLDLLTIDDNQLQAVAVRLNRSIDGRLYRRGWRDRSTAAEEASRCLCF